MYFKKGKQQQDDQTAPPALVDGEAQKDSTTGDESKVKSLKHDPTDLIYPSGIKLFLLMTSIFVGMFLVSLVRSKQQTPSGVLSLHVS